MEDSDQRTTIIATAEVAMQDRAPSFRANALAIVTWRTLVPGRPNWRSQAAQQILIQCATDRSLDIDAWLDAAGKGAAAQLDGAKAESANPRNTRPLKVVW